MQSNAWNSQPFAMNHQPYWPSGSSGYYNVKQTMQIQMPGLQTKEPNNTHVHHQPSSNFENSSSKHILPALCTDPNRWLSHSQEVSPNVTVHHVTAHQYRNPREYVWHDYPNTPQQDLSSYSRYTSGTTRFPSVSNNINASPGFEENNQMHGEKTQTYPAPTMQPSAAHTQQTHLGTHLYQSQIREVDSTVLYNPNSQHPMAHHGHKHSSSGVIGHSRFHVTYSQSNPPPPYGAKHQQVKLKNSMLSRSKGEPVNRIQPQVVPRPGSHHNSSPPQHVQKYTVNQRRKCQPKTQQDTIPRKSSDITKSHSHLLGILLKTDSADWGDLKQLTYGNGSAMLSDTSKSALELSQRQSQILQDALAPSQSNRRTKSSDLQQAGAETRVSKVNGVRLQDRTPDGQMEGVATDTYYSQTPRTETVGVLEGQTTQITTNTDNSLTSKPETVGVLEGQTTQITTNTDNSLTSKPETVGVFEGQTTQIITNTNGSLPFRIESVRTLLNDDTDTNNQSNQLNLIRETSKDLLQPTALENNPQSSAIPQNLDPIADLMSQSPQRSNERSCLQYTAFNMTDIPVDNFTLRRLKDLVKYYEAKIDRKNYKETDVKCILNLYWKGCCNDINELKEQLEELGRCVKDGSGFLVKDDRAVVLQHVKPKNLNLMNIHTVENETSLPLPTEYFKSSWLNVGGPADLDKVLAEPFIDPVLTLGTDNVESLDHNTNMCEDPYVSGNEDNVSEDNGPIDTECPQLDSSAEVLVPSTSQNNQHPDCQATDTQPEGFAEVLVQATPQKNHRSDSLATDTQPEGSAEVLLPATTQKNHRSDFQATDTQPEGSAEVLVPSTTQKNQHSDSQAIDTQPEVSTENFVPATTQKNQHSDSPATDTRSHKKHLEEPKKSTKQKELKEILINSQSKSNHDFDTEHGAVSTINEPVVEETDEDSYVVLEMDEEMSELADVSVDSMEVTMLSISEAREIFKDDFKDDQPESRLCQDEMMVLPVLPDKDPEDGCQNVRSNIKFTCPHVTDKMSGSDLFCPSCLGKTQIFTLDLDEDEDDVAAFPRPLQPEHENVPVSLESCSLTEAAVNISGNTRTANTKTSWIPKSAKAPSLPQLIETSPVSTTLIASTRVKSKKFESIKPSAENAKTNKKYLNNQRFSENRTSPMKITIRLDQTTPSTYKVSKNTLVKRQQGANVFGTIHCMTGVPHKPKRQSMKKRGTGTKQKGPNKGIKKVRFELFGSSKGASSCQGREKIASTPVFLTISANTSNTSGYSDSPSAKQKVFDQWSKTFVPPKQKATHKKAQSVKSELNSRVQMLKILLEDRMTFRENLPQKRANESIADDDVVPQQPKKIKTTAIEFIS